MISKSELNELFWYFKTINLAFGFAIQRSRRGVENEAIRNGYSVLIWNVFEDPKREALGVETYLQRQMDAIIITIPIEPKKAETALLAQIPVIQVERPTQVQSHKVLVDNCAGAVSATEHLINLGHKRIGYIGSDPRNYLTDLSVDDQCLSGYRDTLLENHITPSEVWYASGKYYPIEDGDQLMEGFLQQGKVTAVIAACNILAAGALQAVYRQNLRIPEDISVVSFDDTCVPCLSSPLTTVRQPMFEIGQMAARISIESRNSGAEIHPGVFRIERLSTHFTVPSSTSAPKPY